MRQFILTAFIVTGVWTLDAAVVRHELTIGEKTISPAGKQVTALTINNGIPGPILRFKVGDTAQIRVHNQLPKEKTLLHWHGLLVPNGEDGVPMLNTPPIPPGGSHDYEFELKHAGT